jgi:phage I-like protein
MPLYAACVTALPPGAAHGEIHLFPDGPFRAHDGRPAKPLSAWQMDAAIAQQVQARFTARGRPLVVDYEHQTLKTETNGQPAPAAGWIDRLEWRPGVGLVGLTRWTRQAQDWITSDPPAYGFSSPFFSYEPRAGAVIELFHAALTNDPAVDALQGVVARAAARFALLTEVVMDTELLTLLNLPADADAAAVRTAVATLQQALTTAETATAALRQQLAAQPPLDALNELRQLVATLQAQRLQDERTALVTAACADGRLLGEAMIAWARAETTPLEALTAYLAAATPVAALTRQQTAAAVAGASSRSTLTDEQQAVATRLGLSVTDYLAGDYLAGGVQ